MVLSGLIVAFIAFRAIAVRTENELELALEANFSSEKANMCDQWLLAEFDDGIHDKADALGSFRYLANKWGDEKVAEKQMTNGCLKTYHLQCAEGSLIVTNSCPDKEVETEKRCFGSWYRGCSNRRIDVKTGETLTIFSPAHGTLTLTSGHISFWTADPSKGINLQSPPGRNNWKTAPGCYCCKRKYGFLDNPFSASSRRYAWHREHGTEECMLAWKMIGNGFNSESPAETSVGGVLLLIPEFVVTAADIMTGTVGRHIACAATCPMRSASFEEHAYPFTKIQTDMDKY